MTDLPDPLATVADALGLTDDSPITKQLRSDAEALGTYAKERIDLANEEITCLRTVRATQAQRVRELTDMCDGLREEADTAWSDLALAVKREHGLKLEIGKLRTYLEQYGRPWGNWLPIGELGAELAKAQEIETIPEEQYKTFEVKCSELLAEARKAQEKEE